ncbi:MAG TPA: STAS domain-containing protein [Steroidobacteraceae bacterium]|nr:STAS domain-containing protein [Steroidobacteraceae bacterium]
MAPHAPVAAGAAPASGTFQLLPGADGRLAAQGPLTFATARKARELGRQALAAGAGGLEIDCSGVSAADSAGLAVLIDWLAAARAAQRTLRYTGLPEGLAALGRISEVQELLESGV